MEMKDFDTTGVRAINSGIFGLPHTKDEASIVLIPVPWDVTTSYMPGTHKGPRSIKESSPQLDLYHPDFPDLWKQGVHMLDNAGWILAKNEELRADAEAIIDVLEDGGKPDKQTKALIAKINKESAALNAWLKKESLAWMEKGKIVGVVGGDHAIPLGNMQAVGEKHGEFGILHFDAHHDYRKQYMGFDDSHASIMYNAAQIPTLTRLVQVGIRDYCTEEMEFAKADPSRFVTYYDMQLKEERFHGKTWYDQCIDIVRQLPDKVYISFDIDGLAPHLCPSTGTPVPGGLSFEEAVFLIKLVAKERKIVGFDLVEVGGEPHSIDANIGARVLWHMCGYASISKQSRWSVAG